MGKGCVRDRYKGGWVKEKRGVMEGGRVEWGKREVRGR